MSLSHRLNAAQPVATLATATGSLLGATNGIVVKLNLQYDWGNLAGESVEIRLHNAVVRRGVVESVMPDGSILWISPDGPDSREMVDRAEGFQVWSYQ